LKQLVAFESGNGPEPKYGVRKKLAVKRSKSNMILDPGIQIEGFAESLREDVIAHIKAMNPESRYVEESGQIDQIESVCCRFLSWRDRRKQMALTRNTLVEEVAFVDELLPLENFFKKLNLIDVSGSFCADCFLHAFPTFNLVRIILVY